MSHKSAENEIAELEHQLNRIIISSGEFIDNHTTERDRVNDDEHHHTLSPDSPASGIIASTGPDQEDKQEYSRDTLQNRKDLFVRYIQDQIQTLKIRTNVLHFKYIGYKSWFEFYNITILILSALLTFLEAMRTRFDVSVDNMNTPGAITMGVMPIIISTIVTIASALVKFKRYQVKMENIQSAIQKSIFTSYRLKRIQENVKHLQTDAALEKLIQTYSGEPYDLYVQSQEEMEKNLRYEDLVKHMRTYYALSLEYEQNEMEYRLNRMLLGARQEIRVGNVDEVAATAQNKQHMPCRVCTVSNNASCLGCFGSMSSPPSSPPTQPQSGIELREAKN